MAALFPVERARGWSAAAATSVAILYGAYILHTGPLLSSDSRTYSMWADTLLAARFNYQTYLTVQHFVVPPVLYVLWITVVALSKVVLGEAWPTGIVFLNWLVASALVYGIARVTARVTGSVIVGLVAVLLFAASFDVLLFLPYVLSDIMFMAISGAIVLAGLLVVGEPDRRARRRAIFAGTSMLLASCVFRPTAAPLVVFWCACLLVADQRGLKAAHVWYAIAALAAVAAIAIVAHAALMQDPSRWPGGESGWIRQLSNESRKGIVVFGRPDTYVSPPRSLADFAGLTLTKWEYYFAPWMAGYSRFHKLAGAAFFLTAYTLSLVALFTSPRWRLTSLLVLYIGAFSLFHGVQQIDYDHRYRLPILLALSVLAALGLEQIAVRANPRAAPAVSS